MSSIIKKLASTPTRSYPNEYGIPLDLSYITDRILVCSCPASSFPQTLYRNSLNDLVNFLDIEHWDHWAMWNFKAENLGDYSFDHPSLKNKVNHFPWNDHQPPTFQLLLDAIDSIYDFLSKDPKNVALLHCKMGKGRSGLISVAYLMVYENYSQDDACQLFTEKRMNLGFGEGVSILSQQKYLYYCSLYKNIPYECHYPIKIDHIRIVFGDQDIKSIKVTLLIQQYSAVKDERRLNSKDIVLESWDYSIYSVNKVLTDQDFKVSIEPIYPSPLSSSVSTSFNAYWELIRRNGTPHTGDKGVMRSSWDNLDGFKGTQFKGKKAFDSIEIYFTVLKRDYS